MKKNLLFGLPTRIYKENNRTIIGIYERYVNYFARYNISVVILTENNYKVLFPLLDGLCLIGGGDVNPLYYNKIDNSIEYDSSIDNLEILCIQKALEIKIPILGICRGLQLLNVYFNGTLKEITLTHAGSHQIINRKELVKTTNSFHHQCIDKIATNFNILAKSEDYVIEEIEDQKRMIYAVQYHPEINLDYEVLEHFLTFFK